MTHKIELPGYGPYYVFECGHFCSSIQVVKNVNSRQACPCCGSWLVGKLFICQVCEKPIITKNSVVRQHFCDECKKNKKIIYDKLWEKPPPPAPIASRTFSRGYQSETHTDCIFYEAVCLPNAAFKNQDYVRCRDCRDYMPFPLHASIRARDSFTPTTWGRQ